MLKQLAIYSLTLFFILFFYFSYNTNRIKEGQTTSKNLSNNAYMNDIDTKLDDILNKLKTVKNKYPDSNGILMGGLKFGLVEMNPDPTADPEIYITGDPPNQTIHLKLPKGIKGPRGCQGPRGPSGQTGESGDLGNQGSTGLNILPSLMSNRSFNSIE